MKTLLFWSSGKDSAHALHTLRSEAGEIVLVTTYSESTGRVPFHEVPIELVRLQADALGLSLITIALPSPCGNVEYVSRVAAALTPHIDAATRLAFADLYLAEIRSFREEQFARLGCEMIFPLWKRDTAELAQQIADLHRAVVTCVDTTQLDAAFVGRVYDAAFIAGLPAGVDPCGENGEFHTFVYGGVLFAESLSVSLGLPGGDGRFVWVVPAASKQP